MNLFNARSELLKLFAPHIEHRRKLDRWRGRTIVGQEFGLTINEELPEVCLFTSGSAGATADSCAAVASQDLENANG